VPKIDQALVKHVDSLLSTSPFYEVEEEIDAMPLDDEQKSALWLYAWSTQPDSERLRVLLPVLGEGLAAGG
jgi:hypothetical protein